MKGGEAGDESQEGGGPEGRGKGVVGGEREKTGGGRTDTR